jgi:GNAT superfamily N-acetyltransferase
MIRRMTYEVRRIEAGEWRELKALRLEGLLNSPEAFGTTYEDAVEYPDAEWQSRAERESSSAQSAFHVALDESGSWVGMMAVFAGEKEPPAALVASVYVTPAHRGTDVAALLMTASIEWARTTEAERLILSVREDNPRAHSFYKRLGFTDTGHSEPDGKEPSVNLLQMSYEAFR